MTSERRRNFERRRRLAAKQKRRKQKQEDIIKSLFFFDIAVVIFTVGVIFGQFITNSMRRTASPTASGHPVTVAETPAESAESTIYYTKPLTLEIRDTSEETETATDSAAWMRIAPLDPELQKTMYICCEKYGVPLALALAVAEKESEFNPDAVSKTSDFGLMQINTCNFEYLLEKGIDPCTYEGNIEAGVLLLGENLELYGDEGLAVMAYNCGRAGARRLWADGVYSTSYSRDVMELYEKWLGVTEVQR